MQLALQTDSVGAIGFELHPLQLVYNVPNLQCMRDAFVIENEDPHKEGRPGVRRGAASIQPLLAAANMV